MLYGEPAYSILIPLPIDKSLSSYEIRTRVSRHKTDWHSNVTVGNDEQWLSKYNKLNKSFFAFKLFYCFKYIVVT